MTVAKCFFIFEERGDDSLKVQKTIDIYLVNKRNTRPIDVVQGNTGIQLVFTIKDFDLPSGTTATLFVQKPSGNFVYQEDEITIDGNKITIDLENQAIVEKGNIPYQVDLKNGSDEITTFEGLMIVNRSLKDAGATESKTVIRAFDNAVIERVASIRTQAEKIASEVIATIPEDYTAMEAKVNEFANAIKGNLSGAVVKADDVSPVEHSMKCIVRGKNFFDISKIVNTSTATNNGDGSITIAPNTYYCRLNQKLCEVCPQLKVGDTVVLSFKSTSENTKYMYFHGLQGTWLSGHYITITREILDSYITIYGFADNDASYGKECVVSDIQIEIGKVATEYTPYIDPSTVTVKRCGKNMFPVTVGTYNGVTLSKHNDYYILNGTATGSGLFITKIGRLQAGTYTLSANNPSHNSLGNIFVPLVQIYSPATLESIAVIDDKTNGVAIATIKGGEDYESRIRYQEGITYNNFIIKPQFEFNNIATEYEAYKEATTHIPESDGTVKGVTSLSPNMTILTDTKGMIVECEYNVDTKKYIKKHSGGGSARIGNVLLTANGWIGAKSPYSQVVSIDGITENSQVDLTPSVQQLSIFYEKDLGFVTENVGGVVTVYAIGQKPTNDYNIQVTITEVDYE